MLTTKGFNSSIIAMIKKIKEQIKQVITEIFLDTFNTFNPNPINIAKITVSKITLLGQKKLKISINIIFPRKLLFIFL